ncbi:MAG TPA: hypothetical protein EYP86_04680 [Candidatus Altiarchaeales archaeon]|nr:hypothetical protein [Candidatus Altiarchaeales archaeon]
MITASYYVIKEVSQILEKKDMLEGHEVFEKFSKRYTNDKEFQEIYEKFKEYLNKNDKRILEDIKTKLKKLGDMRRWQTSGGISNLWYKDRRPGVIQLVRIT